MSSDERDFGPLLKSREQLDREAAIQMRDQALEKAGIARPGGVKPELTPFRHLVTKYPDGTRLESLCPECLVTGSRGGKVIAGIWCWDCLVFRAEWIRVVWRRAG